MGSRCLMLRNKSQSFIKSNDKSLSCFVTIKEEHKVIFTGKAVISSVFRKE
jgi:hypothetical protein